jgi:16S rRNA (guanine527-N7)-methyltransferase
MVKCIDEYTFSSITKVSRETISSLKKYEELLKEANKSLNLIGKSTINKIWERHFLDSAQVIDFVDKNDKNLFDIGTGAGFPGLVLAIMLKDRKIPLKIKLIEKSNKKTKFLQDAINELHLNVEVINENVFELKKKYQETFS